MQIQKGLPVYVRNVGKGKIVEVSYKPHAEYLIDFGKDKLSWVSKGTILFLYNPKKQNE